MYDIILRDTNIHEYTVTLFKHGEPILSKKFLSLEEGMNRFSELTDMYPEASRQVVIPRYLHQKLEEEEGAWE